MAAVGVGVTGVIDGSITKTLFVQSTKTNSPMIVTDTIMHCIVCAFI